MMNNIVSVNSDAYEFLKIMYFGVYNNPFEAASNRAYRDLCRTLLLSDIVYAAAKRFFRIFP